MIDFLPYFDFHGIVKKYKGSKDIRDFSCQNQLLMMLFGQLSNCDNMRDLCILLEAHSPKSYRLGFGKSIAPSTLSRANAHRNYRIFEEFAFLMTAKAQKCHSDIDFDIPVNGHVYVFDSSMISLCLNVFLWSTYKRQKGVIKWYTLYESGN